MPAPALLLNGSPHRFGNTMRLAAAVMAAAGVEYETVHLYDLDIRPCTDCRQCAASPHCPIGDDMPALRLSLDRAGIVLIASPLHFTSLTAPLVACIGRLQPYWQAQKRGGEPPAPVRRIGGLALTAGSAYPNMFEPARAVAAAAFKTLGIRFAGAAAAAGTDTIPAERNAEALAEAERLGLMIGGLE